MNSVNVSVVNGAATTEEAGVDAEDIHKCRMQSGISTPQSDEVRENNEVPAADHLKEVSTDYRIAPFPRDSRLWSSLPRMKEGPTGFQVLGYKYLSSAGDSTPQFGCKKNTDVSLKDELPSPLVKDTNEAFFFVPQKPGSSNGQEANRRSPRIEGKRIRRQKLTDLCSLLLLVPGLSLSVLSPFLLIPAYGFDNPNVILFRYLFFVLTVLSVALNIAGGMVGNVMWYFDESDKRWRFKLHCGRGPRDHYWGADLMKKGKSLPDGIV